MFPNVLSIAGSDPSAGAGIQADLKTFAALRCYGMAVITALTAQNTQGVEAIHLPPPDFIACQIDAIFSDVEVAAVKVGMLGSAAIVEAVAAKLAEHHPPFIVLDPVLAATSGDSLAADDVREALLRYILPVATVVTPNFPEAALLADAELPESPEGMSELGKLLLKSGAKAVLLKGGHLEGPTSDDLLVQSTSQRVFSSARISTRNTHGTGCTLSAAIAAYLAYGFDLVESIDAAKTYLIGAIRYADSLSVGHGHGPLHHFHRLW
jgi:hydroxymethylpyrimidine kinase/phosphomethylpyrimidine kinase